LLEVFIGDADLLTAEDALAEFERVLAYEHLPFTATEQKRFPALLRREATVIEPDRSVHTVEDDPDDDLFLQIAVAGHADFVVSGDPHLTDLGGFRDIPILAPAAFLEELEGRFAR